MVLVGNSFGNIIIVNALQMLMLLLPNSSYFLPCIKWWVKCAVAPLLCGCHKEQTRTLYRINIPSYLWCRIITITINSNGIYILLSIYLFSLCFMFHVITEFQREKITAKRRTTRTSSRIFLYGSKKNKTLLGIAIRR